jgi:hypothetical protein
MKKQKKKRDLEKYPNLNERTTLKLRRDYIDNRYYVKRLDEESKRYLDQFNKEYYGASFSDEESTRVHKSYIDKETVNDIKNQIKVLKEKRNKIFNKSANKTTEEDRKEANLYNEQIQDMEDFLNEMFPKRACEHANNSRNRCFLNRNKASNEVSLVSWEVLKEDAIMLDDSEILYQYNISKEDSED